MSESSAAAVKHNHYLVRDGDPKDAGQLRVDDVFRAGHLDFQVMIAGTKGSDLVEPAVDGLFADLGEIRPFDAA
jgi:hypothetical protein